MVAMVTFILRMVKIKSSLLQIRCCGDKTILVLGSARTFPVMPMVVRDWISSLSNYDQWGGCPD